MKTLLARLQNRWIRYRLKNKTISSAARANLGALANIDLSRSARSYRYVVVDLETTGMCLNHDCVVSVGAVRISDGRIRLGDIFNELVNPGRDIPAGSIKIHGIVPDMVAAARPAEQVFERFLAFLGTDILVGHNVAFDLHFINKTIQINHGFALQNLVLDTVPLCRAYALTTHRYPYSLTWNSFDCELSNLVQCSGFEITDRHTALGDALATAMLFQRILTRLESSGRGRLRDLLRADTQP